jgi:acyl dehydratase/putative sterol carrier protein
VTDPAGAERMVQAALARWNRLDAIVNNAGILRDKTFLKMNDDEWRVVIDVHLQGTRNVTKAALIPLMEAGGSIINTTSYSGMIGNFGQSNYAAAKAGIYGLTRVLALELRKAGVRVNAIAPVAKTRMTEDIAMVGEDLSPEQIAPVAVFLASDLSKDVTGRIFGVQGQRIHVYEVKTNDGVEKPGTALWTAEEIAEKLPAILAFDAPPAPAKGADAPADDLVTKAFSFLPAGFKPGAAAGWKAIVQWKVAGGTDQTVLVDGDRAEVRPGLHGTPTCTVKVDKDTLIGMLTGAIDGQKAFMSGKASADNMGDLIKLATAFDFKRAAAAFAAAKGGTAAPAPAPPPAAAAPAPAEKQLPIGKRYEGGFWFVDRVQAEAYAAATDDRNDAYRGPAAIAPPMYHVRPFIGLMLKLATDPALELDILRLVHAEHDMTFHRVLRHGDVLQLRGTLQSVDEKSSGRLVRYGLVGFVDGQKAVEGTTSYFVRAKQRKDEPKRPEAEPEPPPTPDLVVAQVVTDDQATRYAKASGDENPIHVDPATAMAAGLPGVILHGLCTMAFAARDLVDRLGGGDPARLRRLSVRFAKPVLPGQTLTLKVWGTSGEVRFVTENADRQVVIANGLAVIAPE